ncbi:MAG: plastocyanin/azurin family copper-binding protein [Aquihabitans sp.]
MLLRLSHLRTAALILVIALPLGACGDGESSSPAPSAGDTKPIKPTGGVDLADKDFVDLTSSSNVAVQARDNSFVKPYIEVKAGTTITFTNRGRNDHNLLPATDGAFQGIEVENFGPKGTDAITFDRPGDYPYYCSLHGTLTKGMIGAVRVLK